MVKIEEALKGLEASIDRFGLVEPLVYNTQTGNLVGGHQRLKVQQRLFQSLLQIQRLTLQNTPLAKVPFHQ